MTISATDWSARPSEWRRCHPETSYNWRLGTSFDHTSISAFL